MIEIKPCPEITQTQLDAAGFAISGCTEKQWIDASEGTKDLFRDDARAAIEAAVRAGFGASDACASVQRERDELREALREQIGECFDDRCEMCMRHEAILARYEGGRS